MYDTTNVDYKAVLKNWFKGTGGGSGVSTRLESWDEEQLMRHDVDLETYDHTNLSNRPSILLDCYCSQRTPYLTVIFLWDEACDFLLASRHDPLKCGRGEPGMNDSVISTVTSPSKSPQKGKLKTTGLDDMMKSVIDYCKLGGDGDSKMNTVEVDDKDVLEEDLPRSEILELINQHKLHLAFLKENDMCSEEDKMEIVSTVKRLFGIINNRSRKRDLNETMEENKVAVGNKRKVSN